MPRSTDDARPNPDDLLRLAERGETRGKLKVYLGMAAGVGKTWKMLDDAHAMRRAGIDVVVGLIETHGRTETAARVQDLEVLPRCRVEYRGVVLEELDLDGIIERRPDVVVVDELPHSNASGMRYEKRWQDVEQLLREKISVMTALNVQHLEGVQDVVESATGIEIRERVPDRLIRDADSVVLVDIPAAELQERLRQGKIYPPEQAHRALENFFRTEMLVRLRELALLQTATYSGGERASGEPDEATAEVRLAVAMPFDPDVARPLILRGSRLAGRMNTRWYALYVRKRREHPENVSAAEHRRLTENVQLAMSLGATVVTREAENVVDTIIEFVREEAINILVVGRPRRRGWIRRLAPGVVQTLIERAPGIDIVVVDIDEES